MKRHTEVGARAGMVARELAVVGVAMALGSAALLMILLGPEPAPRSTTYLSAHSASLHEPSFAVALDVRVPRAGHYRPRLRVQSTGRTPARFKVTGLTGGSDLVARVGAGVGPVSVPLTRRAGKRFSTWLPAGGFRLVVASDDPGARFDAFELVSSESGETWAYEAELGRQHTGPGLMFLSPANSGGAAIGSLTVPDRREEYLQTFRATTDGLEGIRLAVRPMSAAGRIHVRLERAAGDAVHLDEALTVGQLERTEGIVTLRFPAVPASAGESFALGITVEPGGSLQLVAGDPGGVEDGTLRHGQDLLGSAIRFEPIYRSPWPAFGYAGLLAAGVALGWGLFGPLRGRFLALAALGPALLLPAYALYQRDYRWLHPSHFMPDNYDLFALRFHDLWAGAAHAAENLRAFAASYPHAHNPAVPGALSLLLSCGPSLQRLYVALSAGAALVTIGLLLALSRVASASKQLPFVLVALGATHFLFLRTAARTSTDMIGFLFVVASLLLGLQLLDAPRPATGRFVLLVLVLTLGIFVRLSLLPVGPALALSGWLWEAIASRRQGASERSPGSIRRGDGWRAMLISRRLWSWLAVGLLPAALFFGLCFAAGLGHSFTAVSQKGLLFAEARTAIRWLACILILVQAYPLLALVRRGRASQDGARSRLRPATLLGAVWILASLAFIVVSGAPYWNRHFLYVLPGLLLVSVPAFEALEARHPRALKIGVALLCLANLSLVAWNLWREHPPAFAWAWYVLT